MHATEINARCSIARSLDIVGDKWTLLILRDAIRGWTRFADYRARLGIASDVLSDRLARLVEHGMLERRPYREDGQRERVEYAATDEARSLIAVFASISAWGDEHRASGFGPSVLYVEAATGEPVHMSFVTDDGRVIAADAVTWAPGPGVPNRAAIAGE